MWTRNYKNILITNMTVANGGATTTSGSSFGTDSYHFNFKTPSGNVYEIATHATSAYSQTINGCFASRAHTTFTLSSSVSLITSFTGTAAKSSSTVHVGFGSGTTTPSESDYALETPITKITRVTSSASPVLNANGTITIAYSIQISATADVTINEIGLFLPVSYYGAASSASSANYQYYALVNRMVLDEPVSIASDDSATITFSITTPTITFSE